MAIFCYQAKKWIGALAAVLGGLDSLVFTGVIGEHAPAVRREICDGLGHLGVRLDDADDGPCRVHVVRTDNERVIARRTRQLLGLDSEPALSVYRTQT